MDQWKVQEKKIMCLLKNYQYNRVPHMASLKIIVIWDFFLFEELYLDNLSICIFWWITSSEKIRIILEKIIYIHIKFDWHQILRICYFLLMTKNQFQIRRFLPDFPVLNKNSLKISSDLNFFLSYWKNFMFHSLN